MVNGPSFNAARSDFGCCPVSARVVASTTSSGALPATVEMPTSSISDERARSAIAKQSSGSVCGV
jgi:hypothetical protein